MSDDRPPSPYDPAIGYIDRMVEAGREASGFAPGYRERLRSGTITDADVEASRRAHNAAHPDPHDWEAAYERQAENLDGWKKAAERWHGAAQERQIEINRLRALLEAGSLEALDIGQDCEAVTRDGVPIDRAGARTLVTAAQRCKALARKLGNP